jgi:fucose permease
MIRVSNHLHRNNIHACYIGVKTNKLSVVGALIPYMESYYHISYSIMSLVFVGNAIGFISAAFFTNMILGKFGRAKTLIIAELIQLSAYVILVCTPPYPLVVVS